VGRIRHEASLRLERGLQPGQQAVDRVAKVLQLVLRTFEPESLVEVSLGDPAGGDDHRSQRPQDPPGHQPAEPDRDHRHHRQGDPRLHQ
jgi:hypothetical protein